VKITSTGIYLARFSKVLPCLGASGNATSTSSAPLGTPTLLAYSLPYLPAMLLSAPLNVVQGIYAKYFGLSLTTIAGVLLFARLFDAVADPLIGHLSDRQRARIGTRKPFIIVGSLIYIIAGYFLYVPPANVSVLYVTSGFLVFYVGWMLLEVPFMAWGGDLAATSLEKTRVFSFRTAVGYGGLLAFYALPLLPFFPTSEITPETLRWAAIAAGALMLPCLYIAVTRVSDGHVVGEASGSSAHASGFGMGAWFRLFAGNRPFLILMSTLVAAYLGAGIWYGLVFIYVDSYLGLGAQFAQMFLLAFTVGIACTPLWYKLAAWLGKKAGMMLAIALLMISYIWTGILQPGETSFAQLLMLKIVNTIGFVPLNILFPAALSETVDYGTWKFGVSRGGTYFAVYTFALKVVMAVGAALGLAIAGYYGFDPSISGQSQQAVFGLLLSVVWLPVAFSLVAVILVYLIPINARRHEVIRRRLEAREKWQRRRIASACATPSSTVVHASRTIRDSDRRGVETS
jgi:glycoside/pentoside/hexuronide:cation symporter, GPH family